MGSLPREYRRQVLEGGRAATSPLLRESAQNTTAELRETHLAPTDTGASQSQLSDPADSSNKTPEAHSQVPGDIGGSADRPSSQSGSNALESISGSPRSAFLSSETVGLRDVQYGSIDLLSPWFPEVDPSNERARTWRTWHSRQDILLLFATGISTFVLPVDFVAACFTQARYKTKKGVVKMYEGDCSWVRNVDTIIHIFINLLGTTLLGASNLCMQLLAAPTRRETDKAHRQQRWLDIGVPSWRNLKSISGIRLAMWCCLGLSSIPLHFVYNSAIWISIPRYSYAAAVVSESFLQGAPWVPKGKKIPFWNDISPFPSNETWNGLSSLANLQNITRDVSKVRNLTTIECLKLYANPLGYRTNMLMVTQDDPTSRNGSLLQYAYLPATWLTQDEYWPCGDGNPDYTINCDRLDKLTKDLLDHWSKFGRKVLYCISQNTIGDHCRLNYSPTIMFVVCSFSLLKCICIFGTTYMFRRRPEPTLCTIGDAISSFLEDPDEETRSLGIATKAIIERNKSWRSARAIPWSPSVSRWYTSASINRWAFTGISCGTAIIVSIVILTSGSLGTMKRLGTHNYKLAFDLRFGSPNPTEFTGYFLSKHGTRGFIENVIWANYWQMIISLLYLAYNSLLTCQLVADEWSGYARQRKTLRVSHPKAICFGVFMLVIILLNSLRTFREGMPLASTCSAAISAACHRPAQDTDAHLLPVQWGVIPSEGEEIPRCSFTTYRNVQPPEIGRLYLGLPAPNSTTPGYIQMLWRWLANCIKQRKGSAPASTTTNSTRGSVSRWFTNGIGQYRIYEKRAPD